jgi:tetratricopeptide (TPR) repeat protein
MPQRTKPVNAALVALPLKSKPAQRHAEFHRMTVGAPQGHADNRNAPDDAPSLRTIGSTSALVRAPLLPLPGSTAGMMMRYHRQREARVADIFVSYTSSDRDWAFWIGDELEKLGHMPRIHEWEISAGGDIVKWMDERLQNADFVLCVVSAVYLKKDYSGWERRAAQWAAAGSRPNFALPVLIEECEVPTLLGHIKRCDLFGIGEEEARARLAKYLTPAIKPTASIHFPGQVRQAALAGRDDVPFPGRKSALSNITIGVPRHFLGRDSELAAIDAALTGGDDQVAIVALYGLRGVGKTALAAAYARRHRAGYRATWWVRAQTPDAMRADLVSLGLRLGWVTADQKEEAALDAVRERLRDEGERLLLIYDNAIDVATLRPYLPTGGAARSLVTSNAFAWRGIAAPVEVRVWSKEVGADYLIARTGREKERPEAKALSEALGGLTLAHEQAAAYCERLNVSLSDYRNRFEAAPARLLDAVKDAPADYHSGMTVAKAFALAIDEAAKLHPAAEPLILYAAQLAPEPIPLFVFSEAREKFGEPLASDLAGDGLDEAVAALRGFALVDRETIADERDPSITTDAIRLHRLVRIVAAARRQAEKAVAGRRVLIEAMAAVYPEDVYRKPSVWPRSRRLDAIALDLVVDTDPPAGAEATAAYLLDRLATYRQVSLTAYAAARRLFERALAIRETALGPEHPDTAVSLNNLAGLLQAQGDFAAARPLFERALAITEKALSPKHPATATSLDNLAFLLEAQGDLACALPLSVRALAIRETALGPEHPDTARSLNRLASGLQAQGDLAAARPLFERALAIDEKALGREHPYTSASLNNFALLLQAQGDLAAARPLFERALTICEKALGPEHPETATVLNNFALLLQSQGDLAAARRLLERALAIREKALGAAHLDTILIRSRLADLLRSEGVTAFWPPVTRLMAFFTRGRTPPPA